MHDGDSHAGRTIQAPYGALAEITRIGLPYTCRPSFSLSCSNLGLMTYAFLRLEALMRDFRHYAAIPQGTIAYVPRLLVRGRRCW